MGIATPIRPTTVPDAAKRRFERRGERNLAFLAALGRPDDPVRGGSTEHQELVVQVQVLPFEGELLSCSCARMEGEEKDRALFGRASSPDQAV